MIQTVTVDIINDKALILLQDLEHMHLIRLHKENMSSSSVDFVSKYKGTMTKQPLVEIDRQLNELRNDRVYENSVR